MYRLKAAKMITVRLVDGQDKLVNVRHIDLIEETSAQTSIRLINRQILLTDQTREDIKKLLSGDNNDERRISAIY